MESIIHLNKYQKKIIKDIILSEFGQDFDFLSTKIQINFDLEGNPYVKIY